MAKEYQLNCGNYRSFIVEADNEAQAKQRFQDAYDHDILLTNGFQLKDVTSIIELKSKVKSS